MLRLYGMIDSGNCYKPRMLMATLGRDFEHVEVNTHDGGTRSPAYLEKNPNAMVPLLELDDGRLLAESNAILLHLAEGTRFLPQDAWRRALTYQWLFFEQYSHEPNIAVRKAILNVPRRAPEATPERLQRTLEGGNRALRVMERQLSQAPFLTGETLGIADLSLYAYTHEAEKGGFDLGAFPSIRTWLARVAADPGHVPIGWLPGPAS